MDVLYSVVCCHCSTQCAAVLVANKYMSKYTSDNERGELRSRRYTYEYCSVYLVVEFISFFPDDDSASNLWIFPDYVFPIVWFLNGDFRKPILDIPIF